MTILIFIAGLVALVAGADLLVRGASRLALAFGISPLVIGLTIVAFGTSAPEVAVSVDAVLLGKADLAIGNVVGSNIFNVLFILGLSALITPLLVNPQLNKQEVPVMLAVSVLLLALILDGNLSFWDCALMFALLIGYTGFLVVQSRRATAAAQALAEEHLHLPPGKTWDSHWAVQTGMIIAGLALLVLGSSWLVSSAVTFAKILGVSDLVIGLTIVAAGTSMPELATSIMAAIRGERDIAVGNVVGSNTFNILGSLGLAGMFGGAAGLQISPSLMQFDIWVMLAVAVACVPIFRSGSEITRAEGALFFGYYLAYTSYLVMTSQHSAWLPGYSSLMAWVVLPVTAMGLLWMAMRSWNTSAPGAPQP